MDEHKIKNILVIRFRRIGDSVVAMSLCHSLKQTFPEARIDYVLNEGIAPLYKSHPDIDRVITFNQSENKKFSRYIRKVRKIMKETKYDLIIDMRSTLRTSWFSLFSLSTPYRIGRKKAYNFFSNYQVDNHGNMAVDRVRQNLMLLSPLEKVGPVVYDPEFRLYITDKETADFRKYMENAGIDFRRPVILATVTARLAHKVWNKERMKEILHSIIEKYDAQIIFNFDKNEKEFAMQMHSEMDQSPNIFTTIMAGSLRELCALTKNCHFFFGNEGGPRHISQAFEIPSFAIYPPNISKTTWLPNAGERYRGISPDDLCSPDQQKKMSYGERFDLITSEAVWSALDPMLKEYLPQTDLNHD